MVKWEPVKSNPQNLEFKRAKVPGGWLLILVYSLSPAMTFYPDPTHEWKGDSLP